MSGPKYYSRPGLLIPQVDSSEPITLSVDLGRQSLSNSPKRTFYDSYTVSDSQDKSNPDKRYICDGENSDIGGSLDFSDR